MWHLNNGLCMHFDTLLGAKCFTTGLTCMPFYKAQSSVVSCVELREFGELCELLMFCELHSVPLIDCCDPE